MKEIVNKMSLLPSWTKDVSILIFFGGFMLSINSRVSANEVNISDFGKKADLIIQDVKDLKKGQDDMGKDVQGYHLENINAIWDLKLQIEDEKNKKLASQK